MKKWIKYFLLASFLLSGCVTSKEMKSEASLSIEDVQKMAQQTIDAKNGSQNTSGYIIQPVTRPTETAVPIMIVQPTAAPTIVTIVQRPNPTAAPVIPTVQAFQPASVCDRMRFVDDITIADGTTMDPNQLFRKTWRIQNAGSCTWTPNYQLAYFDGDNLSGPAYITIGRNVYPNETIDLSVDLRAPQYAGNYQSNWQMRNESGAFFGTSNAANPSIWVKISVSQNGSVIVTTNPNYNVVISGPNGNCRVDSIYPSSMSAFDRSSDMDFSFQVTNTSNTTWTTSNMDIAYISGTNMLKYQGNNRIDLPYDVSPGQQLSHTMDIILPSNPGNYSMQMGIVSAYEVLCTIDYNITVKY